MTQNQSLVIPESVGGQITFPEPKAEVTAPETPAAEPAAAPVSPAPQATPEPPKAPEPTPEESEVEVLKRVIAADPNLRGMYLAERYGVPYQPPQQPQYQAPPPPPQPQAPQLPFTGPDDFNISDPEHLSALIKLQTQEALTPAMQYIQQLQQQEKQQAEQMAYQQTMSVEKGIHSMMDGHLPGFSEIVNNERPNEQQLYVKEFALSAFKREMSQYPQEAWGSPRLHQEVINRIGPKVKAFADTVGLNRTADIVAIAEQHVQPSAAQPASQGASLGNLFDQAWKQGDKTAQVKYTNSLFDALHQQNRR